MALICEMCEEELPAEKPPALTASGGWCYPAEQLYEILPMPVLCGHCNARTLVAHELGIDIGPRTR